MQSNNSLYCNNCDKYGHTFYNCRKPLVSNGIIAFRKNEDNVFEYLMVCRKHTFGYIDFLRGKYAINNKSHIMDILFEMTNREKKNILTNDFDSIWLELWGSKDNSYYKNEKIFAKEKYTMLMKGIYIKNNIFYNIKSLINECTSSWNNPEWGFPKGRRNNNENNIDCALREWCEESGFSKSDINLVKNIEPYYEYVIGSNYHSYRDTYYIGKFMNLNKYPINYQNIEISNAKWCNIDEVCESIRPYHKERINIIKNIDKMLNRWLLIN